MYKRVTKVTVVNGHDPFLCRKDKTVDSSIGYLAAALIGLSLGLTGGGGSIITVPVLVYLFHIEPLLATTYSLFIVGAASTAGGIRSAFDGQVNYRKAILFAVPAMGAIYFTRHFLLPVIPKRMFVINNFVVSRDIALMSLFAVIMLIVALRMIRKRAQVHVAGGYNHSHLKTTVVGFAVGVLSGIIGAGGGFLIIPALMEFEKLTIKEAVGTSLVIIAANSFVGFLGDSATKDLIDITFLLTLSAISVVGVVTGGILAKIMASDKLKLVFGWFTLSMAIFIFYKEVFITIFH